MLAPVTLTGKVVRLEPLAAAHAHALSRHTGDPETWRYWPHVLTERSALDAHIASLQNEPVEGNGLNFTIVSLETDEPVGATALFDISLAHRRGEIGRTWLAPAARRTGINTEAKYLLLSHAFETLNLLRVQLKTDRRNAASRRAIERLGAQYEGTLRSHMTLPDGSRRDTAYYSILADEWQDSVKVRLERLLRRDAPRIEGSQA